MGYYSGMIAHLTGVVASVRATSVTLDVHGVGYRVYVPQQLLDTAEVGTDLSLCTHLAVREDAMDLFGFTAHAELELFELLIGVSGIGPRSALGIIGLESIERLTGAIAHGDIGYLTKVSGVGKKSAEKIVLELRDRVGTLGVGEAVAHRPEEEDVLEALRTLGYRSDEARDALHKIPDDITEQGDRVKAALQILSGS
jgi:Holliday junction DNA helicase RuvA